MKISEMTNDQAADAMIRLAVPFGNICDDDKMLDLIEQYNKGKGEPFIRTLGRMLPELAGYALKEHKADLYEIVGALTFKKQDEVAKMNFLETVKVIRASYDEVLHSFFTSSVNQIKQSAGES